MSTIPYSDFQKCEIKIGTIIGAERVQNSEKLVKLDVDFGPKPQISADTDGTRINADKVSTRIDAEREIRQIIAGIGKIHAPENLLNTQCTFITNLEPRTLMGLESQGMLLAASDSEGYPVLLRPERPVSAGEPIH